MSKPFDRILIVMFENQYRNYVLQHPFMNKLMAAGCDMTNYFGAFHPSQTNYVASLAGELCNVSNDTPPASPLMQQTLVDLLEPKGVSWKAYMEGYPNEPWNPAWVDPGYPSSEQPVNESPDGNNGQLARYFRKHNAFASYHTIQKDQNRWANIVDENGFWDDVYGKTLPEYSWFTPDIWNDGHYLLNTHTSTNPRTLLVGQMAGWLECVFFGSIASSKVQGDFTQPTLGLNLDVDLLLTDPQTAYAQSNIPAGTLVVVTFDEADFDAESYDTNYDGANQIYTVLLGDMITPGTSISTPHNHYSLIRTIEQNFDLGSLGKNDDGANWIRQLWGEDFSWQAPANTGLQASDSIALAASGTGTMLVYNTGGDLMASMFDGTSWAAGQAIGIRNASGNLAMATAGEFTLLVYQEGTTELQYALYHPSKGWTSGKSLGYQSAGNFALTAYRDYADNQEKMMLCWQEAGGQNIQSLTSAGGNWAGIPVPVGQLTDGSMTLSQLGPSVFLVYKERNSFNMRITSWNTAPFNVMIAKDFQDNPDPVNNTTLHQWSPMDFEVGHFARKFNTLANTYTAAGQMAMASLNGEMRMVHRGEFEDLAQGHTELFGLTGILTAADWRGNGYGTLDQAGWTPKENLEGVDIALEGALAIATTADQFVVVYQVDGGTDLNYVLGQYG